MNLRKPIVFVAIFAIVVFVLFALYVFWSYPFYPPSGGCHFGIVYSLNQQINNSEDVSKALLANGWNFTDYFDSNQISEVDFNESGGMAFAIEDKNIRYWNISAYKNGNGRVDLIDEQGRLYEFFNCV